MKSKTFSLILALLMSSLAVNVKASSYYLTDLGTLGGASSTATSINNAGQVVGESLLPTGETHAFLYGYGHMTDLGTLGGANSHALDINNHGEVVGYSDTTDYSHAFSYSHGQMQDLSLISGSSFGIAEGINDLGQIVGVSNSDPFLYSNGVMTNLNLFGGVQGTAIAINNQGQITGTAADGYTQAFLYSDEQASFIAGRGYKNASYGLAINEAGDVVGLHIIGGGGYSLSRAFLYSNGLLTYINSMTIANDINEKGVILGTSSDGSPVLYENGEITYLNTLVDATLGWTLVADNTTKVGEINDIGQIAVNGINAEGQKHALLLTPVPLPGTIYMFFSSLACLSWLNKRHKISSVSTRDIKGGPSIN